MSDASTSLVDYRNALFQGGFVQQKKTGKGILIDDNETIMICEWQADIPHGPTLLWLDRETYIITEFRNGKLNGNYTYYSPKQTIYTSFKNNEINGNIVLIDQTIKKASLVQPQGNTSKVVKQLACTGLPLNSIIESLMGMGANLKALDEFITSEMLQDQTYSKTTVKQSQLYQFQKGNPPQKVGLQLKDNKLIGYGLYVENQLNGIGCSYDQAHKLEGTFKFGLLHGVGLKSQISHMNKHVFGYFHNGDIRQVEQVDQLSNQMYNKATQIKLQYHIKSTKFFNSYINLDRMVKFRKPEQIIKKIQQPQPQPQPQQEKPLMTHIKSSSNFRTPAKPTPVSALKTTINRLSPSTNRFATSKKQVVTIQRSPPKTHTTSVTKQQDRLSRLRRDVNLVNNPIMEIQKHTTKMHTPKPHMNPQKQLMGANNILSNLDAQTMQLEESIRQYHTLTAMIKAAKQRKP